MVQTVGTKTKVKMMTEIYKNLRKIQSIIKNRYCLINKLKVGKNKTNNLERRKNSQIYKMATMMTTSPNSHKL